MNKTITVMLVVGSILMPITSVFAQDIIIAPENCPTASNHRVFDQNNTLITGCISNDIWDKQIAADAARNSDTKLPRLVAGQTITDKHGFTNLCPAPVGAIGCVDTIGTDAYNTSMLLIAKSLVGQKLSTNIFDGWIAYFQTLK